MFISQRFRSRSNRIVDIGSLALTVVDGREALVYMHNLNPRRIRHVVLPVVFLFALACSSCSKGLQQVSGKVMHKGQPIKGAVVTLHPKGKDDPKVHKPSGLTGEDGKYTLNTGNEPGAPPGEYMVTVVWLEQPATIAKKTISTDPPPDPIDVLKGRYADPKTTKLTVTIKPGVSELDPITVD